MPTTAWCGRPSWRLGTRLPDHDLIIEGMTCAACVARVEKVLNRMDGVTASVSLATERAHVTAPAGIDDDALVAAVRSAGYGAIPTADAVPGQDDDAAAFAAAALGLRS